MTQAELNRQTAIGMLVELYLPTPDNPDFDRDVYLCNYYEARYATGEEVAENILKLASLGRTQRWQAAIKRWAAMVRSESTVKGLRWAFLQGLIFANSASE